MKPILLSLVVPALIAGVVWSLFAQAPARSGITGKVLILSNERAFEGDIEKVGDLYRVRKGAGEIVVASKEVLRLCADWYEAVRFMESRANLDDPDERIRLAKWCQVNHQIAHAMAEAKAALEMRPKHRETNQLVKVLQITPAGKTPRPAGDNVPAPVPHIDLSFESVTAFSLRIQPMLMNTCVHCHGANYHGAFRLYRLHEGGERVATHRNLAAVLKQVSFDKPAASPLLVMAVCAHGDAKSAPLAGRQSTTFQTLCLWLDQTLADNPHLRERAATAAKKPAAAPEKVVAQTPVPPPIVSQAPVIEAPTDEFSPNHFNRAFHPDRK